MRFVMAIRRELVLAGLIGFAAMSAQAGSGGAAIPLGDGLDLVESYNPQARSILIRKQQVMLSPEAVVSLESQLGPKRLATGKSFHARFNVVRDASGRPVVDSIYVFPLRQTQGRP
jgi:hypothetical protein